MNLVIEFKTAAGRVKHGGGAGGAFLSGILATILATPCSAPFVGTAIGAALTVSVVQALSIFFFLGIGIAFPYLLICFNPILTKILPRPGEWMNTFKKLMAFPLLGTIIWLLWVLGMQRGVISLVAILWNGLGISIGLFLLGIFQKSRASKATIFSVWIFIAAITILPSCYFSASATPIVTALDQRDGTNQTIKWKKFSPSLLQSELKGRQERVRRFYGSVVYHLSGE